MINHYSVVMYAGNLVFNRNNNFVSLGKQCSETQTPLRSFENSEWNKMTDNTSLTYTSFDSLTQNS